MTAGFTVDARHTFRDGFRVDIVFFAAVLTGDLHDGRFGSGRCLMRRRCLSRSGPKRDGISTGFAFGSGHSAWNPLRIHIIDFFAFRTGNLHGCNL